MKISGADFDQISEEVPSLFGNIGHDDVGRKNEEKLLRGLQKLFKEKESLGVPAEAGVTDG